MQLRLLVCTWNVGNAAPLRTDLDEWLQVSPESNGSINQAYSSAGPTCNNPGVSIRRPGRQSNPSSPAAFKKPHTGPGSPNSEIAFDTDGYDIIVIGAQEAADLGQQALSPTVTSASVDRPPSPPPDRESSGSASFDLQFFEEEEPDYKIENFLGGNVDYARSPTALPKLSLSLESPIAKRDARPVLASPISPTGSVHNNIVPSPLVPVPVVLADPNFARSGSVMAKLKNKFKSWKGLGSRSASVAEDRKDHFSRALKGFGPGAGVASSAPVGHTPRESGRLSLEVPSANTGIASGAGGIELVNQPVAETSADTEDTDITENCDERASLDSATTTRSNKSTRSTWSNRTDRDNGFTGKAFVSKNISWNTLLTEALGPDFILVEKVSMMQMRLSVYVRRRIRPLVQNTTSDTVGTGVANVVGNKGAVSICMNVGCLSFCFISAHLAAHEGAKYVKERNKDVRSILRSFEKNQKIPVTHRYDHVFFFGDCNYRVNPALGENGLEKQMDHQEKVQYVVDKVESGSYSELLSHDELIDEQQKGQVFANFNEGDITFAPTFKVRRVPGTAYNHERTPSYCDRILWCSRPLVAKHVLPILYNSLPMASSSDHKPVHAGYLVSLPVPPPRPLAPDAEGLRVTVVLKSIKLTGLEREADNRGRRGSLVGPSEPSAGRKCCLDVWGQALFLGDRKYTFNGHTGQEDGSFSFEDSGQTPMPCVCVANIDHLRPRYLTFVFRDSARGTTSAVLPFGRILENGNRKKRFKLILSSFGRHGGSLEAEIALIVNAGEDWRSLGDKVYLRRSQFEQRPMQRNGSRLPSAGRPRNEISPRTAFGRYGSAQLESGSRADFA